MILRFVRFFLTGRNKLKLKFSHGTIDLRPIEIDYTTGAVSCYRLQALVCLGLVHPDSQLPDFLNPSCLVWRNVVVAYVQGEVAVIYNQYYHKRLKKDKNYTESDKNSPKPEEDWITCKFPPVISEKRWNLILKS